MIYVVNFEIDGDNVFDRNKFFVILIYKNVFFCDFENFYCGKGYFVVIFGKYVEFVSNGEV